MYVSDYHKKIGQGARQQRYVDEWVRSDENVTYVFSLVVDIFEDRANMYGNPILAVAHNEVINATKNYIDVAYDKYKDKKFRTSLDMLSYINAIIVLHIVDKIKREHNKAPPIDPLWTMKGPGFRTQKIEHSKNPGYRYAMGLDVFGNPRVNPRFDNSKMYWNKASFSYAK